MAKAKPGDTFMVKLVMTDEAANHVKLLMMEQENNPESPSLPSPLKMRPDLRGRWADIGVGRLLIQAAGWKPMVGGIEFLVRHNRLDGHVIGNRAVALIPDREMSELLIHQDRTRRRGSIILQEVSGEWYGHIRYKDNPDGRGGRGGPYYYRRRAEAVKRAKEKAQRNGLSSQNEEVHPA